MASTGRALVYLAVSIASFLFGGVFIGIGVARVFLYVTEYEALGIIRTALSLGMGAGLAGLGSVLLLAHDEAKLSISIPDALSNQQLGKQMALVIQVLREWEKNPELPLVMRAAAATMLKKLLS